MSFTPVSSKRSHYERRPSRFNANHRGFHSNGRVVRHGSHLQGAQGATRVFAAQPRCNTSTTSQRPLLRIPTSPISPALQTHPSRQSPATPEVPFLRIPTPPMSPQHPHLGWTIQEIINENVTGLMDPNPTNNYCFGTRPSALSFLGEQRPLDLSRLKTRAFRSSAENKIVHFLIQRAQLQNHLTISFSGSNYLFAEFVIMTKLINALKQIQWKGSLQISIVDPIYKDLVLQKNERVTPPLIKSKEENAIVSFNNLLHQMTYGVISLKVHVHHSLSLLSQSAQAPHLPLNYDCLVETDFNYNTPPEEIPSFAGRQKTPPKHFFFQYDTDDTSKIQSPLLKEVPSEIADKVVPLEIADIAIKIYTLLAI